MEIFVERNFFGKYCGRRTGQTIIVGGDYVVIKFNSIGYGRGFFFRFNSVSAGMYNWFDNLDGK